MTTKNKDLEPEKDKGSDGATCWADLIQRAWEEYHGPIIDEGGDEYIPTMPPAFMRGFVDGYEQGKKCRDIVTILKLVEPMPPETEQLDLLEST